MKQKMKMNKIVTVLLLFTMLITVISGCGASSDRGNSQKETNSEDTGKKDPGTETPDGNTAMGRYVENVTDLSDRLTGYGKGSLYKLADGSLVITDDYQPFLISKDNGFTWEEDARPWHSRFLEDQTYVMSMTVGPDNTVAVIYDDDSQKTGEDEYELFTVLLIIKPDGTEVPVDFSLADEDDYLYRAYIADNGRIFVTGMRSGKIYEVKEDGSCELFLSLENNRPELVQFQGNLMIMDGYDYQSLVIYDLEKEEYVEDEVLDEFINENYSNRDIDGLNWHFDLFSFPGEEGVLYLAGAKGVYRHVIGGSAIEQIIDGSLCSLNNPAYSVKGMAALDNNEFLTLFSGGRLVRYVYDPDIPTVPNEQLTVYSLKTNDTIRQAITIYQASNPDVFVKYETGMGDDSSVTKEDALKSLNTRIMAGEGPDVLVLDDMPMDSYIEKGLLLDIGSTLKGMSGEEELFGNIIDALGTDGKVYAMPCEVSLPVVVGREKYVSQASDLKGLADAIVQLREDTPGKDLLGICTEKGIMRMLSMSCVPGWMKENGELDKDAISEFLTQSKRVFDAQMDGIPESSVEHYNELNDYYLQDMGVTRDDSDYLRMYADVVSYIGNYIYMKLGTLTYSYGYTEMISANRTEGFEDTAWTLMHGQSDNVFCAHTLLGINAGSKNISRAEDFIRVCLGKENQSTLFKGFPVNKAAFEEDFIPGEELGEDGYSSSLTMSSGDGAAVTLDIYWPNEKQIDDFRKCMEGLNTAYIEDDILEEAVYEEGINYMQGNKSLEEAVDDIEKKVSIYMAE